MWGGLVWRGKWVGLREVREAYLYIQVGGVGWKGRWVGFRGGQRHTLTIHAQKVTFDFVFFNGPGGA